MPFIVILIWYIVHSVLTVLTLIYKLAEKSHKLFELETLLFLCSGLYFIYMLFYTLFFVKMKKEEPLLANKSTSIIKDHIFKYVCAIVFGCQLIYSLIDILSFNNAPNSKDPLENVINYYVKFVYPICCFIDLFLTRRNRSPNPMIDIIILAIVIIALSVVEWIDKKLDFTYVLGSFLFRMMLGFDGYILYDYIMFKRNGGVGGFALFYVGA